MRDFREENDNRAKLLVGQVSSALLIHLKNHTDLFASFEEYGLTLDELIQKFHETKDGLGPVRACDEITFEFLKECDLLRDQARLKFNLAQAKREAEEKAKLLAKEKAKAAQAKIEADRRLAEQQARAAQEKREADRRLAEEQARAAQAKREADAHLAAERARAAQLASALAEASRGRKKGGVLHKWGFR
jgi:chromosome segregation ATPase